ncbi:MAG: TonB-dependent receptor [Flavobacteriaceae bacterium]|jgi:outer membrane receptor protein involved in Fe transport|nr:TonB-dependent receptor [Flavobacteriaceae bacterium]
MKKNLLTALLIASSFSAVAQIQLKGTVIDTNNQPVGWATVVLKSDKVAKQEYAMTTDEQGNFVFDSLKETGSYTINISFIGYQTIEQKITVQETNNPLQLTMQNDEQLLDEVKITAYRKALQVKPGKATMDITKSDMAQTQSAYDVLKAMPGVTINQNGEIKIKGKSGVTILMDGQPTQLSDEQLKTILKGTPGSTLNSIEIMTIPPANIDASGIGGVINIISKKKLTQGFYGTINANIGVAHKIQTDQSLNLGYGNDHWSYNFLYSHSYTPNRLFEDYKKREPVNSKFNWLNQEQQTIANSKTHLVKFDATRYFSKGHSLTLNTSFDHNETPSTIKTTTLIGSDKLLENNLFQKNNNHSKLSTAKIEGKLRIKLNEKDDWTTIVGTTYNKHEVNDQIIGYNETSRPQVPVSLLQQNKYPSKQNAFYLKSDYNKILWDEENNQAKMAFGIKSDYTTLKTNERLFTSILEGQQVSIRKQSEFQYNTGVHAFYGTFELTKDKWNVVAGLRGELTTIVGDTLNYKKLVKQDYFSLFPSVQVTYTASDMYSIMASYSRRIERPEFDKLNPAVRFLNSTTTSFGNPNLQAEFSNNIEVTQQLLGFIDLSLGYSRITSPMQYSYFSKQIDQAYYTTINGKDRDEWFASLAMPIPVANWWENYHGVYAFTSRYQNNSIDIKRNSIGVYTYNNFKLPNQWSVELSAWYQNGGIESNFKYKALSEVNIGVSKKFWNDRFTATLAVNDLFKTAQVKTEILGDPNQAINFDLKQDSRVVKFGLTYNFGGTPKKTVEVEEEHETKGLPNKKPTLLPSASK